MARQAWLGFEELAGIANGASQVVQFEAQAGETVEVHELLIYTAQSGKVQLLQTTDGKQYTDASSSEDISTEFFTNPATDLNSIGKFIEPIVIQGNQTLNIRILNDSGGAASYEVLVHGIKDTG